MMSNQETNRSIQTLRAEVASLTQLLDVFENATIDQAKRLESALRDNALKSAELLRVERERSEWALGRARALEKEIDIARQIQTSILPRTLVVPNLEIAAQMRVAEVVGGDYYDVMPVSGGCWMGIGDVSGHGLNAGLVMLMTQSIAATLSRANPNASPTDVLNVLNTVLFENIHRRLLQDDFVTLTLLRYSSDGQITFAGAHEEIVICRRNGQIERLPTPGTWVGAMPDIGLVTSDSTCRLDRGDLMVLYTDGITEAMDARGQQFGIDRLCNVVAQSHTDPVEDINARILDEMGSWRSIHGDDATLLVARYLG